MSSAQPRDYTLPTDNLRGALWMLASAACFTVMASCLKLLAERGFAESQMVFFRCAVGFVLMLPLARRNPRAVWSVARPWVMARRCVASAVGLLLAFFAFANMPIATAQALSFSRSLFVVVLAMIFAQERVGVWRRSAVVVGFVGVMVMLRPTEFHVDWAAGAMLASALLSAYTVLTVKDLTRDHSTITLVFWLNASTALIGLPLAIGAWKTPLGFDLGLFVLMAVAGFLAQSFFTLGLTRGEASAMTMLDYLRMPMAVLASFVVFHVAPDGWTYAGAAIVIASSIFITLREAHLARRPV